MRAILIFSFALIFYCCSSNSKKDDKPIDKHTYVVKPLYKNSITRFFSNKKNKDTLKVTLNGETTITGTVYLQIINYKNELIFWDKIQPLDLIEKERLINPDINQKFINQYLLSFFKPDRFSVARQTHEANKSATQLVELEKDSTCFTYRIDTNTLKSICYSNYMHKIITDTIRKSISDSTRDKVKLEFVKYARKEVGN